MVEKLAVVDARKRFAELANRVQFGHEHFDVVRHNKSVMSLVTPEERKLIERLRSIAHDLGFPSADDLLQELISKEELKTRIQDMETECDRAEKEEVS